MRVFCLGGGGKICSEAVRDLVEFSNVRQITIGDLQGDEARRLVEGLQDERVDFQALDVEEPSRAIALKEDPDTPSRERTATWTNRS